MKIYPKSSKIQIGFKCKHGDVILTITAENEEADMWILDFIGGKAMVPKITIKEYVEEGVIKVI